MDIFTITPILQHSKIAAPMEFQTLYGFISI